MLRVKAGAYLIEAANVRHEHEYHLWEDVKLPEGKLLIPGVVSHATNVLEHPELVAERITRFADRVGARTCWPARTAAWADGSIRNSSGPSSRRLSMVRAGTARLWKS